MVEQNAANDSIHQSDNNPEIEVLEIIGQNNLGQTLQQCNGLEIAMDDILLLVGRQQQLSIVEDIARHGTGEERIESKIDQEKPRAQMAEPPGEEEADKESDAANDEADATVKVGQHRHDVVDFRVVVLL